MEAYDYIKPSSSSDNGLYRVTYYYKNGGKNTISFSTLDEFITWARNPVNVKHYTVSHIV